MTRKEYMDALESQLRFLGEDQRAALLEYYGEMIDDRMEDGMDEASAVAAMENPAAIAAQQRGDAPRQEPAPEEMTDEAMKFSALAGDILKATEKLLNEAVPSAADAMETARQTAKESMETARESLHAAKEALKAEKEALKAEKNSFHAGEGAAPAQGFGEYRQQTLTCPAASLRAVSLTCGEMPIVVRAGQGNDVILTYYTCENDPYEAEVHDGVLTLRRAEYGGARAGRFSISVLGGIFRMVWNQPSPTVELTVPADALLDLDAHTSNASIKVSGPRALCAVTLKTGNCRIALEDVKCLTLDMKSSNARLTLENVEAKQGLTGKTSNGRIEARGTVCGGGLSFTTSNSRIEASGCAAGGELRFTTSNGRIQFDRIDGAAVILKTSNGAISGVLPGSQADWAIDSGTSNGRTTLPGHQPGPKPLSVHTSNGALDVRFER